MNGTILGGHAIGAPYSEARLESNLDHWMLEYQTQLFHAVTDYPNQYAYPVEEIPAVCAKMRVAFRNDTYALDSHAIRWTCKHFGIPHTRKAIREALRNGQVI